MVRTKQGLILEKLFNEMKHRYLLCWEGEESAYDCACCLTWSDDDLYNRCRCVCHTRIEHMASAPGMKLFLLAAKSMDELPKFFTSYAEKLTYSKGLAVEHAASRADWTAKQWEILGHCTCEFCEFARDDLKTRKFEIEGEDNSHINDKPFVQVEPDVTKIADFETWWSSTNNQNWFRDRTITLKDLKDAALCAWDAANRRADVRSDETQAK